MNNEKFTVTRNACKLCTPLGAAMAFRGLQNTVSILHGSQGCSTYIRRYMISHFKEPLDIASSNFSEDTAIFGGGENLKKVLQNVLSQYQPGLIGIATTCLSETIGDDVARFVNEFQAEHPGQVDILRVSTPSYQGTHEDGFTAVCRAAAEQLARGGDTKDHINLFPGMVSPADIRYLKEIMEGFGLTVTLCPDYSDTLDGGMWEDYHPIPQGGTLLEELFALGQARATVELGTLAGEDNSAGLVLHRKFGIPLYEMGLPIGVKASDALFRVLEELSGIPTPQRFTGERLRLIDAYADAHKYLFGKKAVVYGEQALAAALAAFLDEIGIIPVLVASGSNTRRLARSVQALIPDWEEKGIQIAEEKDFLDIEQLARELGAELLVGNSKGYKMARELNIPLVRVGFPVHDRIGGQRILHLGYRGAQELFDRLVNAVMEKYQADNPWGYFYV